MLQAILLFSLSMV